MNNEKHLRTLILGIGNILMGDEGLGVHAVNLLEEKKNLKENSWPENTEIMDGGTGGFHLLGPMQNTERLIIIDATIDGNPPGTIRRITPEYSSDYPPTITAHDVGLKDMIDAFYFSGNVPDVILYTMSISSLDSKLQMEMSPAIEKSLPELTDRIIKELCAPLE
jgi:hydrogenase maturation protease